MFLVSSGVRWELLDFLVWRGGWSGTFGEIPNRDLICWNRSALG